MKIISQSSLHASCHPLCCVTFTVAHAILQVIAALWTSRKSAESARTMAGTEVSEVTEAVTGEVTKVRKGKNFTVEEDKQLCRSFLSISQDPIVGNGQKSSSFWERVAKSYNLYTPLGCGDRNARSLECKWGTIRHDVLKFCGVYS
jgi:hypothetical protein